jgi:hypothetical protein|tara:strand:- start:3376 stop:3810 length:435 start_codon:yes stop_codon:yes gene_type:complete
MVKKTKRKSHYNSKDLFEEFKSLYSKQHKKEYEPRNFIGNEMKSLKALLEKYSVYEILSAMYNCIIRNAGSISVNYFTNGIKYYLTDHDPKLYWSVVSSPDPNMKKKWRAYTILNSKWLPTATDKKRLKDLEKDLEGVVVNEEK